MIQLQAINFEANNQASEDFLAGFGDFWATLRAKQNNSRAKQKILKPENKNYLKGWFTAWGMSEGFQEKLELMDLPNSGYEDGYKLGKKLRESQPKNIKF